MIPYHGFVGYMGYIMAFMQEIFAHLFKLGIGGLNFVPGPATGGLLEPSQTQWVVTGNLPTLTDKGEDIVAALMTIIHNGIVAVAQISTLLPYNAL